jgi:2-dehydro-3-deoxygluconokinase
VEVDRLGGGVALAAGFLSGYLNTSDTRRRLATALLWGAATAALKYTIPGDAPLVERHEVEALLRRGRGGNSIQR